MGIAGGGVASAGGWGVEEEVGGDLSAEEFDEEHFEDEDEDEDEELEEEAEYIDRGTLEDDLDEEE